VKSKVKYAVLILVIGLLGLAILASPVFGVKPAPKRYTVEIISGVITSTEFETEGNKPGTRFNPFPFPKGDKDPVTVMLTLDLDILFPDDGDFDDFRWSPIEEDYQTLEGADADWEFHHINIRANSLYCRFDLFYEDTVQGAWDHYVLDIYLKLTNGGGAGEYYDDNATINWTHYIENTKPRGQKPKIEFQQLEHFSSGELTIIIAEKTD
jgi:hypothetical protein